MVSPFHPNTIGWFWWKFFADYMFSNEHINYLITYTFDFRNEELLSYYISFLRFVVLISLYLYCSIYSYLPLLLLFFLWSETKDVYIYINENEGRIRNPPYDYKKPYNNMVDLLYKKPNVYIYICHCYISWFQKLKNFFVCNLWSWARLYIGEESLSLIGFLEWYAST